MRCYKEIASHIIYSFGPMIRTVNAIFIDGSAERTMEVTLLVFVRQSVKMVQQLALISTVAVTVTNVIVSSAAQINVRIVETADVPGYLLQGQVYFLLVADKILA